MKQTKLVYDWMFEKEHTEWQSLIYELVKEGKIDPWDIDVSLLVQEYLKMFNEFKKMNFKLSGNVILALTILIKLKMSRLGLSEFVSMTSDLENGSSINGDLDLPDISEELDLLENNNALLQDMGIHSGPLIKKKMPGPRNRKVTVYELVEALKKAIDVEEKRTVRLAEIKKSVRKIEIEKPKTTVVDRIQSVYTQLKGLLKGEKESILFDDLVMSKHRKDLIWTLVPLLHLCNEGAVELKQKEAFGPIEILLGETEWVPKKEDPETIKKPKAKKKVSKTKRKKR